MPQYVSVDFAPMTRPVDAKNDGTGTTKVACHSRISPTTGAGGTVGALLPSAVYPSYTMKGNIQQAKNFPKAISLIVELASAGNAVYCTVDTSTPSATNGLRVPAEPGVPLRLPFPDGIALDEIKVFNTGVGTANIQVFFEWGN